VATNKSDQAQAEQAPQAQPVTIVPPPMAPPTPEKPLDEVPWEGGGGRFVVNGRLVNHDGEEINEDGTLKRREA
jgi:hypothetical protein